MWEGEDMYGRNDVWRVCVWEGEDMYGRNDVW